MAIPEEILRINSRVGVVETHFQHLSTQINDLQSSTKENFSEVKRLQENLEKEIDHLCADVSQIKIIAKILVGLFAFLGADGVIIIMKTLGNI